MTSNQWIQSARDNREALLTLITAFHPCAFSTRREDFDLPITAPAAEDACRNVRAVIVAEGGSDRDLPREFDAALEKGDCAAIYSLLDQSWFGVPESTGCWDIPGFKEAVDLMDDLPDEMMYPPEEIAAKEMETK